MSSLFQRKSKTSDITLDTPYTKNETARQEDGSSSFKEKIKTLYTRSKRFYRIKKGQLGGVYTDFVRHWKPYIKQKLEGVNLPNVIIAFLVILTIFAVRILIMDGYKLYSQLSIDTRISGAGVDLINPKEVTRVNFTSESTARLALSKKCERLTKLEIDRGYQDSKVRGTFFYNNIFAVAYTLMPQEKGVDCIIPRMFNITHNPYLNENKPTQSTTKTGSGEEVESNVENNGYISSLENDLKKYIRDKDISHQHGVPDMCALLLKRWDGSYIQMLNPRLVIDDSNTPFMNNKAKSDSSGFFSSFVDSFFSGNKPSGDTIEVNIGSKEIKEVHEKKEKSTKDNNSNNGETPDDVTKEKNKKYSTYFLEYSGFSAGKVCMNIATSVTVTYVEWPSTRAVTARFYDDEALYLILNLHILNDGKIIYDDDSDNRSPFMQRCES